MTVGEVGADLFAPFPLKYILDTITHQATPDFHWLPGYTTIQPFLKKFDPQTDGVIIISVALLLLTGLLNAILSFFQLYLAFFTAKTLTNKLSKRLFDHLQRLSVNWHSAHEQGDVVQRISGNMADLEKFIADGMIDAVADVLTLFGVLAVMLWNNLPLTVISFVIIPPLGLIILRYTRAIKAVTKKEKKAEGQVSSVATDAMAKIKEIKAFTLEPFMFGLFSKNADTKLTAGRRAGGLQAQFTPFVDVLLAVGNAIILGVGSYCLVYFHAQVILGPLPPQAITLGTLPVFLSYLKMLYQPMRDLSKLTTLGTSASAAAERIQEVLNQDTEDLNIAQAYSGPQRLKGNIEFEEVYFCYSQPGALVLKGVNLQIPAGKKVALVGLSGCGKTTLTNLLPRFHDSSPQWGEIRMDGVNIAQYPLTIVRKNISIVLQDSILFDGTIRENIKIGRPEATETEMIKAAEQACIHETIAKKLGGYDARIVNQGKNLSGGQRQRIAIARAILRDTPIIIMDEPTASLDVEAEAEVMRALDGLAEGRTVLMITHRLSTVGKVDRIVVMEEGRIVEQGTYQELKVKDGAFASLLKIQNAYDINQDDSPSLIRTSFLERPDPTYSTARILIEIDGKVIGQHALDKVVLTVGRMIQNDIRIPGDQPGSQLVSRLHAKILWKENQWMIENEDSKFGLYYRGKRVDQIALKNGDRINIAPQVALIYVQEKESPVGIDTLSRSQLEFKSQVILEMDGHIISQHPLNKNVLTIGRKIEHSSHDIQIPSQYIARNIHAQIARENGTWVIKNMTNRTALCCNGQFVNQHTFRNGDRIYLAPNVALRYQTP
jgi:ABC-type multidrug transport system fused ATPase/permease subunit/pSer/pThr/pTyr-binding forkhead associated (FHA) protein